MKAEKSHDLPPTSWSPGKAGGVIQSESKGLSTRETHGVNPDCRVRKDELSQLKKAGKKQKG